METVSTISRPHCGESAQPRRLESSFLGKFRSPAMDRVAMASSERSLQVLTIEASKRKGPMRRMQQQQQMQQRSLPKVPAAEDDNPRFVIFIRSKNVPLWYPLNIVSGGNAAKFMVGVTKNEWGKKIYGNSLTNNIGAAVYKDEEKIIASVVKTYPTLKTAKEFQFGYKLVDEEKANEALRPVDVTLIPPKEDLKPITEKVTDFVGKGVDNLKSSLGL
ncbi:protein HHL1, chloroplastic [Selaginella moellendorffii]|nr:protein HHL1, chloroplastic [Selaginella moellendorffii]XP_024528636.1 protein HHL1, chloroplastic [Selaginella moellendorffii]|eukprot:XP_002961342.2 protein HHL1, chloroplastic [Selaginella moellendorffii]